MSVKDYASDLSRHQPTSQSMLGAARSGESDAWTRLAFVYAPIIAEWGKKQGVSNEDLDDFIQNVFAGLVLSISQYAPDQERFRYWLLRLVRERAEAFIRQSKLEVPLEEYSESIPHGSGKVSEEELEHSKTFLLLRACELIRREFAPRTFEIFLRTALHGEDTGSVAIDLRVTSAAVRQAKSRVTRRLREVLADEFR